MNKKLDRNENEYRTVELLLFNPKELDLSRLRELPEINFAAITAIPKDVLDHGRWK